jgi:hypothetical protein
MAQIYLITQRDQINFYVEVKNKIGGTEVL